ncbi:hypothetical protein KFU94_35930 [Chloroflexi bacterium TSY]|nr:hypothetical protein [Chloroflexi bacterium TSY]
MAIRILSDENCHGQVEAVFNALDQLGYVKLLEVDLLTWEEARLTEGIDDETIWRFCQDNNCLLLTGNRTGDDDTESLEHITRTLVGPDSLPVLTFGNLKRVIPDRHYCRACAQRLADIIFDLENYRGVPRLYLP